MKMSAASQGRAREGRSSREFTASAEIAAQACVAIRRSEIFEQPWRHWQSADLFPRDVLHELTDLPLSPAFSDRPAGRREYHNGQRIYFDCPNMARFPVMRRVAEALQSPGVVRAVHETLSAPIGGTFLRIEYALDTSGFWLEPHTDIGVKKLTGFLYLDGADNLGTDMYADPQTFTHRVPFIPNWALAFVPSHNTWHGFAPRPIAGARRSLIINYVGAEWRAREQLSFPDRPVPVAR
jgi:hypothetical protein